MPARKNRPGKHGTSSSEALSAKQRQLDSEERGLIDKLCAQERKEPHNDHYVGWPDMGAAERLAKKGYIIEGGRAKGCFCVTPLFRQTFMTAGSELGEERGQ